MREKRKNLALMPPSAVSDLSYFLKLVSYVNNVSLEISIISNIKNPI